MKNNIFKILAVCCLLALVPACSTPKPKKFSEEEGEQMEERVIQQWENARKRMKNDGYGEYDSDGMFIWKKKVIKKDLKILNRRPPRKSVRPLVR